jgi:hypothetical protein
MTDIEVVAVISACASVLAALVGTWRAAAAARQAEHAAPDVQARLAALEAANSRLEAENRALWLWARKLVDHIYRGAPPPPPTGPIDVLREAR